MPVSPEKAKRASGTPSYAGWRAELLAQMALSRVPELVVHKQEQDLSYDFVVAAPTGVCFFVIVKAFSSAQQRVSNPQEAPELKGRVRKRVLAWAARSRSPVFAFLVDIDTDHSRYLRLDGRAEAPGRGQAQLLGFPRSNTLDKRGIESLLSEIGAFEGTEPVVVLGRERTHSRDVAKELGELINTPATREMDIVRFLERNPSVLLVALADGQEVFSQVLLEKGEGQKLIPDFVIKPHRGEQWSVVDLKRPSLPIFTGHGNRRRLSAHAAQAVAQAREYKRYFESPANRKRIKDRYGIDIARPKVMVIIGRTPEQDAKEELALQRDHLPDVEVLTYDQLLSRFTRKGSPDAG